jgi:hypothetical protein
MSVAAVLLALVGRVLFSFVDPAIDESSGLVDLGSLVVTTDDSGGDPLVFVVDPRSGRTVGHATFTDRVVDVEALAPAGDDVVWVGDIGDNDEQRDSVRVYRVPVARGDHRVDAPSYELVYPDGAHDAESLVAAPDGRLYVVTKGLLGGTAYVAPRHLDPDRPNRLRPVAPVDVWATDATGDTCWCVATTPPRSARSPGSTRLRPSTSRASSRGRACRSAAPAGSC